MFLSLSIKNSFLDKDLKIDFSKGLNVLVGKNNSGKSTTIEMLNFTLFGSPALRSSVSDYPKDFEVESQLKFFDVTYKVKRTARTANVYKLLEDSKWEPICTGVSPVNLFLKNLLSYDYKVFSLTNYCKQHDLLNLTSCTPAALVSLIEVVSGLEDSYRLMAELKNIKRDYKAEVKSLTATERFANRELEFEEDEELEELFKKDPDTLANFKDVSVNLFNTFTLYSTYLQDIKNIIKSSEDTYKNLEDLSFNYPDLTVEDINSIKTKISEITTRHTNILFIKNNFKVPTDKFDIEFLKEQKKLILEAREYSSYLNMKKDFDDHSVECPSCEHVFNYQDTGKVLEEKQAPETPQLTDRQVEKHLEWLSTEEEYKAVVEELKALEESLKSFDSYSLKLLDQDIKTHTLKESYSANISKFKESYIELVSKIGKTTDFKFKDKAAKLGVLVFERQLEEELKEYKEASSREYTASLELKDRFNDYLVKKKAYLEEKALLDNLDNLLESAENKENISNLLHSVLIDTKKEIQQLSLPVLNSIASNILSDITGGERNKVEITEDFRIEVDNVNVNVIEGSAQVITNLSLRIALLNTFYKDNFLVCLFDEIDESLHEDRFEYMEECFNRLSEAGYQIIAVSHKTYTSGNIINLHEL